ncbi:MAG TPA: hypothetical protein VF228_16715 [Iamia sp.]
MTDVIPNERRKLAVTQAGDAVKQVLTLSTAILTFTIAFSKDVTKDAVASDRPWLYASWLLLAGAVVAGVLTLLAIAGQLGQHTQDLDVYSQPIRTLAAVQMLAFGLALVLIVVFGIFALTGPAPAASGEKGSCTIAAPATGSCQLGGR